ncbi:hypothetical protein LUQ84_001780 [Hamiltosporidium tvaerminnensis]|nr:hypothetical protein LUQ84_001780 [Hamiltosporidium tvaerminnensis]
MIKLIRSIHPAKKYNEPVKKSKLITSFLGSLYVCFKLLQNVTNLIKIIVSTNFNICSVEVSFVEIENEIVNLVSSSSNAGCYFLCVETCSLRKWDNHTQYQEYSDLSKKNKVLEIVYPNEIFLEFEFFDEQIIKKKKKVEIYIKEKNFYNFLCFIQHLKSRDSINKIKPEVFFEIIKYLNIFGVKRDKKYKAFIKALIYNLITLDEDYFVKKISNLSFNLQKCKNIYILDALKCFCRFYFLKKHFIYEVFDEYIPPEYSLQLFLHKKYKKAKNFTSMQFINFNLNMYFYRYLCRPKFREMWIFMMKILYVDKLSINFVFFRTEIDIHIILSSLPQNVQKITITNRDENIFMFDLLQKYMDLSNIKKLSISIIPFSNSLFEKMKYFKNLEQLTLEIREISMKEIIELETSEHLKRIKSIKLFFFETIDTFFEIECISLLGTENNIFIYLLDELKMDNNPQNMLENFIKYNFYNYLSGVNLILETSNYSYIDFAKILPSDKLKCLKLDIENVKDNKLENYDFLAAFKNLKFLFLTNIEITNELFIAILRQNQLISLAIDFFTIDTKLDCKIVDLINKSVVYMEFYNLSNYIGKCFLGFIAKFKNLKHLIFDLYISEYTGYVNSIFQEEFSTFEALIPTLYVDLPKLESLVYKNEFDSQYQAKFSVLHVISFFFNLEMINTLFYDVGYLYPDDLRIFENFKELDNLKLSIKKNDSNSNILQQILISNIKKTISTLKIVSNKYNWLEIISIYKFRKLKFLELGSMHIDDKDVKYYDLLFSMNLILCEKYTLKKIEGFNFTYFQKYNIKMYMS